MRLLALLLLLTNFLVFAWIQWGQSGTQPIPAEIHRDKISLIPSAGLAPTAPAPIAAQSVAPALAQPAAASASVQPTVPSAGSTVAQTAPKPQAQTQSCMEWGPIAAKRASDAQARLLKLKLGDRLSYTDTASRGGPYWVYFPPLPTKLAADDKLTELQGLGIKDIAVVRTGPWQNAISMGLYSKAAIADARVENAAKKGVAAKIEARGPASRVYTLRNLSADEHDALIKLQTDFGGPPFKKTACPTQ